VWITPEFTQGQRLALLQAFDHRRRVCFVQDDLPQVRRIVADQRLEPVDRLGADILALFAQLIDKYLHLR
jgi:hypothetical protein